MTTSERLADALFTKLDDGRWEHTVLPLMKTRILTDEEKHDVHAFSRVWSKGVLYSLLGLLIKFALFPWLLWLAVATNILYYDKGYAFLLVLPAFVPLIAFGVVSFWQMAVAKTRVKYRRAVKSAPRGRRVKWASFWRLIGSALGPLPIQVVLTLAAICLFGTILLSVSLRDAYLNDIVNMA